MTGEEPAGTIDFSWKCVFNIEGKNVNHVQHSCYRSVQCSCHFNKLILYDKNVNNVQHSSYRSVQHIYLVVLSHKWYSTVLTFNSCTKGVGSPDIIDECTPDCHPVSGHVCMDNKHKAYVLCLKMFYPISVKWYWKCLLILKRSIWKSMP